MYDHIQLPLFGNTFANNDIPRVPGIYLIRNLSNGHIYVGSTTNLWQRWRQHRYGLMAGYHHNPHLQNAWNKYGAESFRFEVLEQTDRNHILEAEQKWIDAFQAGSNPDCYNLLRIAGTTAGRVVSEETRKKMSASQTGKKASPEARERMRLAKVGKKLSPEHIEKVRQTSTGRKYGSRSEAFKQKFRALSPEQITELKKLRREGLSYPQLARLFGIALSTTQRIVKGESCKGVGDEH